MPEVSEAQIRAKLKALEADFVLSWLRERHDVALFLGVNAKVAKKRETAKKERVVCITRQHTHFCCEHPLS